MVTVPRPVFLLAFLANAKGHSLSLSRAHIPSPALAPAKALLLLLTHTKCHDQPFPSSLLSASPAVQAQTWNFCLSQGWKEAGDQDSAERLPELSGAPLEGQSGDGRKVQYSEEYGLGDCPLGDSSWTRLLPHLTPQQTFDLCGQPVLRVCLVTTHWPPALYSYSKTAWA